jgi:hypothetical protein
MPIFRTVPQPMPQQIAFNQVVTPLSGNIRSLAALILRRGSCHQCRIKFQFAPQARPVGSQSMRIDDPVKPKEQSGSSEVKPNLAAPDQE